MKLFNRTCGEATPSRRRAVAIAAVVSTVLALASALVVQSANSAFAADASGPGPIAAAPRDAVTADALPTVQIDGVAWTQLVVGNTVYVGGNFTTARPAGAAAGVNTTPRSNMLAYDITTGNLIDSFAPVFNGQVRNLALSPDGTRFYAVGDFTNVDGHVHNRIAAFNAATGALLSNFTGGVDAGIHAIAVTNSTVYVGGLFQLANGNTRTRLAAFDTTGALTAWAPSADDTVEGMIVSPDGTRVIVGGHFLTVNGASMYGMGALDSTTGANLPWPLNTLLRDAGNNSAMLSFTTDGTNIIGTGYSFSQGGNFEGTFAADPTTGKLVWMEDCHGDTYGAFASHGLVYTISHAHFCANDGGWPVYNPWQFRRSLAFTNAATGTLLPNSMQNYTSFAGQPAPSLVNWFPDFTTGTFTGQGQAAWTVTGNDQYVVEGGEFPTVNNGAQQGLVRFAVRGIAPAKQPPRVSGANFVPTINTFVPGTAHISWQANWDRDDKTLTYKLVRNSDTAHPIWTGTADSTWWDRPGMSFTDTGLVAGTAYKYRLYVIDGDGNQVAGDGVTYTVPTVAGPTGYDQQVIADGASTYLPLDEASGAIAYDNANGNNADVIGATRGTPGPVSPETGTTFAGSSSSYLATREPILAPNTFTISAWVKTTTTRGGKIVSFGSFQSGNSTLYDRQLYLDNSGRPYFGVKAPGGSNNTINSTAAINDGQWHNVVGQLSPAGMALYVDGLRVGRRSDTTAGQVYVGFWRIGGDAASGWNGAPTSGYLNGSIADVAFFPSALSSTQLQTEYKSSGRTLSIAAAPSDTYGQAVYADDPDIFWRMDETSGALASDASRTLTPGTYFGNYALNQASPVTPTGKAVFFSGSNTGLGSTKTYVDPLMYSEEAWFKTSTTAGGKILGFGNKQSGLSTNYDRHVYMLTSGKLVFGVSNGGQITITSAKSYNDNKWHQVVATQGPTGMTLYVDGLPVGSNSNTGAQNYTGNWRVGGDSSWSGANYFNGTIDEASFYSTQLSAARVLAHYKASNAQTNIAPVAAFTSSATYLDATFDGTGSSDVDGTVASYAWTFGDGGTATGATPTHSYTNAGTYTVSLVVTDNEGGTNSLSKQITVTNPPPNQNPTASFTQSCVDTSCNFDASASTDPDGSIVSYAWDFGDGSNGAGGAPSHVFPTGGSYPVQLTVTDNRGGTDTKTATVTVTSVNVPPTAAISATVVKLAVSVDASASTDPDGTIVSYAWNFGDGSTATGVTANHRYAAPGNYTLALTVTDDRGGTKTATKTISAVSPGIQVYASDAFGRNVANGLGSADVGGSYTLSGSSSLFSVSGGTGQLKIATAGSGPTAYLNAISARDVQGVVDFTLDGTPTGGGSFVYLVTRHAGTSDYRLKVKLLATSVSLTVTKVVNGTETALVSKTISGLTYTAGDTLRARFEAVGATPTTLLGKVWSAAGAEPASWQVSTTDSDAALQGPGSVGYQAYLSASSTTVPVTAAFDNLSFTSVTAAAFNTTPAHLTVGFDGTTSTSIGGTVTSYAWNFGDGGTATGATPSHTFAADGTYTVTLTVTDSVGGVDSVSKDITVAPNAPPAPAFTVDATDLTAAVNASGSSDPDGTIASYAWDYGDGTNGTGVTATHAYAAPGTYSITLTVTDNDGSAASVSHPVTVTAPNQPPTASFTSAVTNLSATFDGSASADPDGSITSYAWDFGDGTTGSGVTPSHTYAAAGTYLVSLTVTDDRGATATKSATVTATPVPPVAADQFGRTVTNGWGTADTGGSWTLGGSSSLFSVAGGLGKMKLAAAGAGPNAYLNSVSARDVNELVDFTFDSVPTGGGTYAYVVARHVGSTDYRFKVKVLPTAVTLYLSKVVAGTETTIVSKTVTMTYALGDVLRARFVVTGTGTTSLAGKVWKVGTTEPAAAQLTATDAEATLQGPGAVGLQTYLSGSSTTVPVVTSFANFSVSAG